MTILSENTRTPIRKGLTISDRFSSFAIEIITKFKIIQLELFPCILQKIVLLRVIIIP